MCGAHQHTTVSPTLFEMKCTKLWIWLANHMVNFTAYWCCFSQPINWTVVCYGFYALSVLSCLSVWASSLLHFHLVPVLFWRLFYFCGFPHSLLYSPVQLLCCLFLFFLFSFYVLNLFSWTSLQNYFLCSLKVIKFLLFFLFGLFSSFLSVC